MRKQYLAHRYTAGFRFSFWEEESPKNLKAATAYDAYTSVGHAHLFWDDGAAHSTLCTLREKAAYEAGYLNHLIDIIEACDNRLADGAGDPDKATQHTQTKIDEWLGYAEHAHDRLWHAYTACEETLDDIGSAFETIRLLQALATAVTLFLTTVERLECYTIQYEDISSQYEYLTSQAHTEVC